MGAELNKAYSQQTEPIIAQPLEAVPARVEPTVLPADERQPERYIMMRQGPGTNPIAALRVKTDKTSGLGKAVAQNQHGTYTLMIPDYSVTGPLDKSAKQMLDILIIALTQSGLRDPTVIIRKADFMKLRGLKDEKEAKKTARANLKVIGKTQIEWDQKDGQEVKHYAFMNIADSGEVKRNGDIYFTFSQTFIKAALAHSSAKPYMLSLLRQKREGPFAMGKKINMHKAMNQNKKGKSPDILAVKTLLENAPDIPTYDEVMKKDRHLEQRIIRPFERNLDAFADDFTWEYCHSKGIPLTEEELANMNYFTFEKLFVKINWITWPERQNEEEEEPGQPEAEKKTE